MALHDGWALAGAAALVIVAGLLAMAESALTSFSKARADELVNQERQGAARLRSLIENPATALNTALFLRIAAEITAVVLIAVLLSDVFDMRWPAVAAGAVAMIVVSYVVIGVAPRTIGRQHAETVALASAGPLLVITKVLGPIPRVLIALGNLVTPGRGFRAGPFATEAELRELVDLAEAGRVIESGEREMIHSVFDLGDTIVREVMVPRPDVVFIESGKTLRQFQSLALRSGFSRIPVVGSAGLDDVVGVAYLKDAARRLYDHRDAESVERVSSIMRPAAFVPDSKPVDELLREMQAQRIHVTIVVDEYGGTAGLVTIEDILEEIVGEISDEYDAIEEPVTELDDGAFRVSARLHVSELGELFGIELSDEDVDSVGGLMAKALGRVPIPGAEVDVAGLHLVAEHTTGRRNRIRTIHVTRCAPAPKKETVNEEEIL